MDQAMAAVVDALAAPAAVSASAFGVGIAIRGRMGWIAAFAACMAGYALLLEFAGGLPDPFGGGFSWLGKVAGVAFAASCARLAGLSAVELGLRPPAGRWRVTLAGVAAAVLLAAGVAAVFAGGGHRLSVEGWLFQASMPGLDEELAFRGIGLALLLRAYGSGRGGVFWAAAMTTALFGLGHGLGFADGHFRFGGFEAGYTLVFGSLLVAVRLGSNSLLGAVLAHNLGNLSAYAVAALVG